MADPLYGLTAEDVRFLRTLKRKELTGENIPRPRYRRKPLPFRYPNATLVRFQLTEALVLGLEADAVTVEWDGAAYVTTTTEIVVKDYTATPGSWSGPIGRNGWATLPDDANDGKYEIVWMENVARFIEFVSTEDMGYTTAGEMEVTVTAWYDIKQPSATVIATDPRGLFTRAKSGAKGIAWYNPKTDKYVIVECQSSAGWIQTTLTADMASNSAAATVQEANGSQQDVQDPDPLNAGITVEDQDGLFTRAMNGAKGIAIYDAVLDDYTLVESQSKAGWIRGTLNADMSAGSSAGATVSDYGGSQQDVQSPGSTVTVYDPQSLFTRAKSGAGYKAIYDAVDDKYNVVECESKAGRVSVTLTADMASNSATATVSRVGGSQQDVQTPGSITVYDESGLFPNAKSGAVGEAIYDATADRYRIVACNQLAIMVLGSLQGAMATSDTTKTVDGLTVLDQTPFNQSPGSSITASNTFSFEGDDNATVLCVRTGTSWRIIQVMCPA